MKKGVVWLSCVVLVLISLLGCGNTQTEESGNAQDEDGALSYIFVQNPKTTYAVGEEIDQAELAIVAVYSDGKTETITSGFTWTPITLTAEGSQTVIVNYEGKTTSFSVTVTGSNYNESEESSTVANESEETTMEESNADESMTAIESVESASSESPSEGYSVSGDSASGVIEETKHSFVLSSQKDPSCTEYGHKEYTCSICGEKKVDMQLPLGHDFSEEATCTSPKTCTRCGVRDGTPLGHLFVDGICSRCSMHEPFYKMSCIDSLPKKVFSGPGGTGDEMSVVIDIVPDYDSTNVIKGFSIPFSCQIITKGGEVTYGPDIRVKNKDGELVYKHELFSWSTDPAGTVVTGYDYVEVRNRWYDNGVVLPEGEYTIEIISFFDDYNY